MIEMLLQAGASNAIVAAALAGLAWAVHRSGRRPALAHGLWVLVLLRVVVPPVLTLPLVSMPGLAPPATTTTTMTSEPVASVRRAPEAGGPPADAPPRRDLAVVPRRDLAESAPGGLADPSSETARTAPAEIAGGRDHADGSLPWAPLAVFAAILWAAGSLAVLGVTVVRAARFHRQLLASAVPAPEPVRRLTDELAVRFGLRRAPQVLVCPGRLAPLVWWVGGRVRIVVPAALADQRDAAGHARLRWILAHELAHVRRRDHLVRGLECAACTIGWWNPVAWWTRRRLRLDEEACCDALVLRTLEPRPREYAGSLLSTVQLLAGAPPTPGRDVPALASGLDAGGTLERRIAMIARNRPSPGRRRSRRLVLAVATLAVLPLGLVHSQDMEAVGARLRAAVSAGELSESQAGAMMERLAEVAAGEPDRRIRAEMPARPEAWDHRPHFAALFQRAAAVGARGELESDELESVMRELKLMLQLERIADNLEHGTLSAERADEMIRDTEAELEAVRGERRRAVERFVARTEAAAHRGELSPSQARDMIREAEARADRMHELVHGDPGVTAGRDERHEAAEAAEDAETLRDALEELRAQSARRIERVDQAARRGELTLREADLLRQLIVHRTQQAQVRAWMRHGDRPVWADTVLHGSRLTIADVGRKLARALEERVADLEAAARRGALSRARASDLIGEAVARGNWMDELVHGDMDATREPAHDAAHESPVDGRAEDGERAPEDRLEPTVARLRTAVERGEMEAGLAELRLMQERATVIAELRREEAERLERRSRELLEAVEAGRLSVGEALESLRADSDAVRTADPGLR